MRASNALMVLWDYCIQRRAKNHSHNNKIKTASSFLQLTDDHKIRRIKIMKRNSENDTYYLEPHQGIF